MQRIGIDLGSKSVINWRIDRRKKIRDLVRCCAWRGIALAARVSSPSLPPMSQQRSGGDGRRAEAVDGPAVESPRDRGGDPHDDRPFAGMRFLLIPSPGQERLEKERLEKRIAALGGQVLAPLDYRSSTHVCLESEFMNLQDPLRLEGKEPVSHDWVNEHFDRNNLVLDDDDDELAAPQGNGNADDCNAVSSKGKEGLMSVLGSENPVAARLQERSIVV